MKFKNPICVNCNASIQRQDIDMATDVAICKSCDTIYKFSNLLYSNQDNSHKKYKGFHDGFLYEDFKLIPSITLQLRKLTNFKLTLFMSAILLLVGCTMLIIPDLIAKLFSLVFLFLSGYLIKEGLYRFTSVYLIELGKDVFRVLRNGQEKFKIIPTDIAQIYIKRRNGGSSGSNQFFEHDIYLRPKVGEDVKLVKHLLQSEVAFEIERIIENAYGIEDIITKDEYHPKYSPQGGQEVPQQLTNFAMNLKKNQELKKNKS